MAHELAALPAVPIHAMNGLEFVRRGLAVSVTARLALPDAFEGVIYRPLLPAQPRTVGRACLDVAKLSPLVRAFWRIAKAQARIASPNLT